MRRLIFTSSLLVLCGIFLLLWDSPPEAFLQRPEANTTEALPAADSYMLNTRTLTYNSDGSRNYTLNTSETRYFRNDDRFEMDNPEMVSFSSDNPLHPWQIEAVQGEIFNSGEKVILSGKVYAWQDTSVVARNELRSPELVFFPDNQIAETDKKVTLSTPQGQTRGVGMWANLQQEQFKLLNQVKGVHRAPH